MRPERRSFFDSGTEADGVAAELAARRFPRAVGRWIVRGAGWPVLAAAALGLAVLILDLVRRRQSQVAAITAAVTLAGAVPIIASGPAWCRTSS